MQVRNPDVRESDPKLSANVLQLFEHKHANRQRKTQRCVLWKHVGYWCLPNTVNECAWVKTRTPQRKTLLDTSMEVGLEIDAE